MKKVKWVVCVACLGINASSLLALDPDREITQYVFRHWGVKQGLPQNSVHCMAQTDDGFIWFGTQEGLARFDGHTFQPTGERAYVNALLSTHSPAMWASCDGPGTLWLEGDALKPAPLANAAEITPLCFFQSRHKDVWIGTISQGVFVYRARQPGRVIPLDGLPLGRFWSIQEDENDTVWIAGDEGLAEVRDMQVKRIWTEKDGMPHRNTWALYPCHSGGMWVGTREGFCLIRSGQLTVPRFNEELSNPGVLCMLEDRDGNVWAGTFQGVVRIDRQGRVSPFRLAHGLPYPEVLSLLEDRDGSIWVGLGGGGVCQFSDGLITPYTSVNGLPHDMARAVILDPDGTLWVGTDGGLARIKGHQVETLSRDQGLSSDRINSIAVGPDGTVWVGTLGAGLNRFDGTRWSHITKDEGLPSDNIGSLWCEADGSLWVGTFAGLAHLHVGGIDVLTKEDGLASNLIRSVYRDRSGVLWVGTAGAGLNSMSGNRIRTYTTTDGLAGNHILCFLEDDRGRLWVGTAQKGMSLFWGDRFLSATASQGLIDNTILDMQQGSDGQLWASTNHGLMAVDPDQLAECMQGRRERVTAQRFARAHGMKSSECNGGTFPSSCKTPDGRLWFPTTKGVVSIRPGQKHHLTATPNLHVMEVRADGKPLDLKQSLTLGSGVEQVSIQFTGVSFHPSQSLDFTWRLLGQSVQWQPASTRRSAHFTNLRPGEYRFQLRLGHLEPGWSDPVTQISFTVTPSVVESPWFRAGIILLVLLSGFGVHRFRMLHIQRRKRELHNIVEEQKRSLEKKIRLLVERQELIVENAQRSAMSDVADRVLSEVATGVAELVETSRRFEAACVESQRTRKIQRILESLKPHEIALKAFLDDSDAGRRLKTQLNQEMQEVTKKSPELANYLSAMESGVDSLVELIAAQQRYARMAETDERVDLNLLLIDALRLFRYDFRRHNIRIHKDLRPLVHLSGSQTRLIKVVTSLLRNSLDALKDVSGEKAIRVKTQMDDETVRIIISDNGVGMTPEQLSAALQKGFTTKSGHVGNDLYEALLCVSEIHGKIIPESEGKGRGATFTLEFPNPKPSSGPYLPPHSG